MQSNNIYEITGDRRIAMLTHRTSQKSRQTGHLGLQIRQLLPTIWEEEFTKRQIWEAPGKSQWIWGSQKQMPPTEAGEEIAQSGLLMMARGLFHQPESSYPIKSPSASCVLPVSYYISVAPRSSLFNSYSAEPFSCGN